MSSIWLVPYMSLCFIQMMMRNFIISIKHVIIVQFINRTLHGMKYDVFRRNVVMRTGQHPCLNHAKLCPYFRMDIFRMGIVWEWGIFYRYSSADFAILLQEEYLQGGLLEGPLAQIVVLVQGKPWKTSTVIPDKLYTYFEKCPTKHTA